MFSRRLNTYYKASSPIGIPLVGKLNALNESISNLTIFASLPTF